MKKNNTCAAETIPIRLIVSVAIISIIMIMIGFGYKTFSITLAQHQIERECRRMLSSLQTMVSSGSARDVDEINAAAGSTRTFTFMLPSNLRYLAFGVDPDPYNNGSLQTGLTADGSLICYQVEGGSKQMMWLPTNVFCFRQGIYQNGTWRIHGSGQGYLITHGGKITLSFELVQHNAHQYILIHHTDSFE